MATVYDTTLVMKSLGAAHRVWNNKGAQRVLELESLKSDQMEIFSAAAGVKSRLMYDEGDLTAGIVSCGQGIGLIHDIPTVRDFIERIMKEAEDIVQKLHNS